MFFFVNSANLKVSTKLPKLMTFYIVNTLLKIL